MNANRVAWEAARHDRGCHCWRHGVLRAIGWPTVTGLPGSLHAVFEDASLPHQIRLFVSGHEISVTCTCLGARNQAHQIIASRTGAFPAAAAMAAYRQ